jgi:cytochrome b subunit of formate dehydrogenase
MIAPLPRTRPAGLTRLLPLLVTLLVLGFGRPAEASRLLTADAESCLSCHRHTGLGVVDEERDELRLFFCSERYHANRQGPHARLECTDCHHREEVEEIPHQEVSPVDCTQTCHLVSSSGAEITFSHEKVAERMARSVHNAETFAELPFEQPLVREGQASCLFCHDQPRFRNDAGRTQTHRGHEPSARCETCHDEGLPVDVSYFVRHTQGRLNAARHITEQAEICGACHSNPELAGHIEKHDSVTSYFHSFHGKAARLGDPDTATCMHCHQSAEGDVHMILSKEDEASRTHEARVHETCRTVECHPNAVPELSSASVHVRLEPRKATIEYIVMAAFLVLTASVMTIYFLLLILEQLNNVVRREDAEHRQLVSLAEAVMKHPEGRRRLMRLDVGQRVQHWLLAISFILLVLTGMPLKFSSASWAPDLIAVFGGVSGARLIHRINAIVISLTWFYHWYYLGRALWGDVKRRMAAEPSRKLWVHAALSVYHSPITLRPQDVLHFAQLYLYLLGLRKHRPEHGRFHFSQKFEWMAVFWGMIVIGSSGAVLWAVDLAPGLLGGRVLNFALIAHSDEAFLAFIYIAVVHFVAVVFSPSVFPLSKGSLTGEMPAVELAEAHIGHLRQVADELGISVDVPPPHRGAINVFRQIVRRGYALGLAVAMAVLAYASTSFLVHEFGGPHDAVDTTALPLRLVPEAMALDSEDPVAVSGANLGELSRSPVAHFHQVQPWFTPDAANGCAAAGCHTAMPHSERKESRAFLNMHATFTDCLVCHTEQQPNGDALAWVNLEEHALHPVPAVLQLASLLDPEPPTEREALSELNREVLALLDQAIVESGGDGDLRHWREGLRRARVGGPLHAHIIRDVRAGILLHGHGEYGARLGIPGRVFALEADQQAAAEALRAAAGDEARESDVELVHRGYARPEVDCLRCHSDDELAVDYDKLGYTSSRIDSLRANEVVRQVRSAERGETFYLPTLLDIRSASGEAEGSDAAEGDEAGALEGEEAP